MKRLLFAFLWTLAGLAQPQWTPTPYMAPWPTLANTNTAMTYLGVSSFAQSDILDETSAPPILKNIGAVMQVTNIYALTNLASTTTPGTVEVLGFAAVGDGGGGTFKWQAALPQWTQIGFDLSWNTNLCTIAASDTGYWVRDIDSYLNVKWFGAVPDDDVDDSDAINAALAISTSRQYSYLKDRLWTVHIPSGKWTINNNSLVVNNATTANYGVCILGDGDATVLHSTNDTAFVILNVGSTEPPSFFDLRNLSFVGRGSQNIGGYQPLVPLSTDSLTGGLVGLKCRATFARVHNVTGVYLSTLLWVSPSSRQLNGRFTGLHAEICYYGVYADRNNASEFQMYSSAVKEGFNFLYGGVCRVTSSSVEAASIGLRAFGMQSLSIEGTHFEGCTNASVYLEKSHNITIRDSKLITAGNAPSGAQFKAPLVMTNNTHNVEVIGGWVYPEYSVTYGKYGNLAWLSTDSTGLRYNGVPYNFDDWSGTGGAFPVLQDLNTAYKQSYFSRNNNYVVDGGFEAGTNYWTISTLGADDGAVTFASDFIKEGKRAFKFTTGASWTVGDEIYIRHTSPVITNAYGPCLLSVWAKCSSMDMAGKVNMRWFVNGNDAYDSTLVLNAAAVENFYNTNWTFFSAPFTLSVPVTNVICQFYPDAATTAGGILYVDNVTLVPAYSGNIGEISRNDVYDSNPLFDSPVWLDVGGTNVINKTGTPAIPYWNGTSWTTGSTNAIYTPPLRFPVAGEDNIGNLTNYVTPSLTGNEKAWTGQSYDSATKLWQAVSISATQIATNSWLSIVPQAANIDYTSVARISTNNTVNALLGFTLMTNAVIGTEYTYQGYAMAEAETTLSMGITPSYATNVVWQTSTKIGTSPTFFKLSVVAVHTNAIRCFRIDANAGTDFLIVSNVTFSVGGYWPVDGVRVFPSAITSTMGWRQVGPNTYSTRAIAAASDWIYADAETIVLVPTGAIDLTTALPTLIPGVVNQIVDITSSSADAVTFNDNGSVAGTLLELGAATRAVATNDILRLKYNGTSWVEAGFFNN